MTEIPYFVKAKCLKTVEYYFINYIFFLEKFQI